MLLRARSGAQIGVRTKSSQCRMGDVGLPEGMRNEVDIKHRATGSLEVGDSTAAVHAYTLSETVQSDLDAIKSRRDLMKIAQRFIAGNQSTAPARSPAGTA